MFSQTVSSLKKTVFFAIFLAPLGVGGPASAENPYQVKDIRPGVLGSGPSELVTIDGVSYFTADDGSSGLELWKSDGTAGGTTGVKDTRRSPSP